MTGMENMGFLFIVFMLSCYHSFSDGERHIKGLDLWSEDTKQDAWSTQGALDDGFAWMEVFPNFQVYLLGIDISLLKAFVFSARRLCA